VETPSSFGCGSAALWSLRSRYVDDRSVTA
jgi:hypothetical protein